MFDPDAVPDPDGLDAVLGAAWRDEFPWRFLTRLIEAGPRLGGSPGERRAADVVTEAFGAAGAGPEYRPFETARWERGGTDLAVRLDRGDRTVRRSFEAVALPYSPAGEVRAPLVDVGYGTPEEIDGADVAGAIAVASTDTPPDRRFVHRMETFGHAVAAGARAFLFANHVDGQLPPTGALRFGGEAAAPGAGVSTETGAWLTDYAGEGAEAHLRIEATTETGTSGNVVGTLGPDRADDRVVLLAHYDAHDVAEGALDNGCGIAVTASAARLLSALEADLDRQVVVAGVGCEETGLGGAEALAADLGPGSIAAVVNVDGAGRHRDLRAYTHTCDALADLGRDAVETAGQPLAIEPEPHPYSDHWPFLRSGVPALQLHSTGPGDERGRGWGHTAADTRDKVDARTLRSHAALTALLVRRLATGALDLPRIDPERLAGALRAADAERGMRAAGVWPDEWGEAGDASG